MSLSASGRPKVVTRSPSNTSLNVGLPPPIPSSTYQTYTSSATRRQHQPHRGDVSSTATSDDDGESEDDMQGTREPGWVLPPTPARVHVPGALNGMESSRKIVGKRMTLQERLAATASAAKMKKSDSNSSSVGMSKSSSSSTIVAKIKKSASSLSDMGGNAGRSGDKVVVCVRIKPTTSPFSAKAYGISHQDQTLTLADSHPNVVKRGGKSGRESEYTYNFDALLEYPGRTPDLYQDKIAPLVDKTMNGFNSTIFAYGQTGSGKSFTMTGTSQELGIIPCAVDGVFDAINNEPTRAFLLRVSYVEIYNETIRDLLNFKKGPLADDEKPVIHTLKGKVYVEPLKEEIVSTPHEVVDLLERGNLQRRTGATDWNERSSRSHSVFTITVESSPRGRGDDTDTRRSCLNLIDLAGSEKAVSDLERRGEGKHINQSLLALREVINKLTEKHKKNNHIPYRNSKLTHLLENALDGQSNIAVICTLSVEEAHCAETLETLKFAGRCSQVETKAQKNILPASEKAVIRAKEDEISELKRQLQMLAAQGETTSSRSIAQEFVEAQQLQADLQAMEDRKQKLSAQLAKLNSVILTSQTHGFKSGRPRRRISDSAQGLGLGSPLPLHAGLAGRRAVSGMSRVSEDAEPVVEPQLAHDLAQHGRSFKLEREIASLRRNFVAKEAEMARKDQELYAASEQIQRLVNAEQELQDLRALQLREAETTKGEIASSRSRLADVKAELERTRRELVLTTEEKDSKLADLEKAVLELRQSREELLVEEQKRYDELEKRLLASNRDLAQLQQSSATGTESLQTQLQAIQQERDVLLVAHKAQVDAHRLELDAVKADLSARLAKVSRKAEKASIFADKCRDLSSGLAKAEETIKTAEANRAAMQTTLATTEAARDAALLATAATQAENERLRQAAIHTESTTTAQLRGQVAQLEREAELLKVAHAEILKTAKEELAGELVNAAQHQKLISKRDLELLTAKKEAARVQEIVTASNVHIAAELVEKTKLATALKQAEEEGQAQQAQVQQLQVALGAAEASLVREKARSAEHASEVQKCGHLNAALQARYDDLLNEYRDSQNGSSQQASRSELLDRELAIAKELAEDLQLTASATEKQVENSSKELASLKEMLTAERASSALELRAHMDAAQANKTNIAQLQTVIVSLESKVSASEAVAAKARSQSLELQSDLLQERTVRAKLEKAVVEPAAPLRSRHASTPAGHGSGSLESLAPLQELVAATTGSDPHSAASKLQSRERGEIMRLEKIVEGQKGVIEELKAKLLSWQKLLLEQEKVVKLLTEDGSVHASHKLSQTQVMVPLSPSRRQSSVESTVTMTSAKALAKAGSYSQLAAPGTPTPLPHHPTQQSNSSARKGRRITIEHDMNRLASNRPVDRAKAMFTTPDQPSTPSRLSGQSRHLNNTPTSRKP